MAREHIASWGVRAEVKGLSDLEVALFFHALHDMPISMQDRLIWIKDESQWKIIRIQVKIGKSNLNMFLVNGL